MQPRLLWRFLGFFQSPRLRRLHAAVVLLVIAQIASGYAMSSPPPYPAAGGLLLWYHIAAGLVTLALGCVLTAYSLRQRGLRHFYPYLWGETRRIREDILKSLRFQLVAPGPEGLASAVQGLGFGALLLSAFSGAIWFFLWVNVMGAMHVAKEWHVVFAALLQIYFAGHGGMALLHFGAWQHKSAPALRG